MSDDLVLRLLVVAVIVVGLGAARVWWRARQHRIRTEEVRHPALPADLRGAAWVVFTTPWCATCGPTADLLRRHHPEAAVVTVDVVERPDLAQGFRVRAAPTVVQADGDGTVIRRLVGAAAVRQALAQPAQTGR